MKINGRGAQQSDDTQRHPQHAVNFSLAQQQIADLGEGGRNRDRGCQHDGCLC